MISAESAPLLMAVDGNSLLHRAHHAHEHSGQRDDAGRAVWALRGLLSSLGGAAARLTPDAVAVGFDCHGTYHRKTLYPPYKAGRRDKSPELIAQLDQAPELLRDSGFTVIQHDGWEADDVLASIAASARRAHWRCTVVTSDRDSFALIDHTTSVLRVITGGIDAAPLLTPTRMLAVCGVEANQYRDYAALRGDPSDNLPGVRGVGAKTAAKLLAVFSGVDEVYQALTTGRIDEVTAVVGPSIARRLAEPMSRENVTRNVELMRMREDLDVPVLSSMRVPLDLIRIQTALRQRNIHLGPSLWALTGGSAPGEVSWDRLAELDEAQGQHVRSLPGTTPHHQQMTVPSDEEPEFPLTLF